MSNARSASHAPLPRGRHPLASQLFGAFGCARRPAVETGPTLPLRRVVVYRNGVGYFERQGHVEGEAVNFRVTQSEVGDFLATLAVMEQGGSSVRSAAFPMPEEQVGDAPPAPERRRNVRLALDGREHDLVVGYTVETPIWRPTYRLVFQGDAAAGAGLGHRAEPLGRRLDRREPLAGVGLAGVVPLRARDAGDPRAPHR
jgi:hypothetical protein